jgi:hypothetical protein
MERGKNKIKLIEWGVVACFMLIQVYLVFMNKHLTMDIDAAPNAQPTPHIMGDREIGQTFIAARDNLSRIEVMMGTFGRENDQNVIFKLGIPNKKVILRKVFNASEVKNNLYHAISFSPQKDSKGKRYYFSFSSPDSTLGDSICAWSNPRDIYRRGEYFFNRKTPGGDLVFRTYSFQPVSAILGKINKNYPGIWGSPAVLILTMIFFVVMEVVVLFKLLDLGYQYLSGNLMKKEDARV